ncbi:MAG: hypothetical protein IH933_15230 [Euryarchaeota archaeon]|jgi:siroheme synthase (precorrin-2 oxidase/ferrochelatase)|nr:hypothetical protein [Euryarchaeota archaeon]
MRSRRRTDDADDAFGFDDPAFGFVSRLVGPLVPQWLARRGLSVAVETDRNEYAVGQPVEILIEIRNRLPVPVELATDGGRIWGWTVDGLLEASDERYYRSDRRNSIALRAGETRTIERTWSGRFKRTGSPTRWIEATPGTYEIGVFVPARKKRISDTTTISVYRSR